MGHCSLYHAGVSVPGKDVIAGPKEGRVPHKVSEHTCCALSHGVLGEPSLHQRLQYFEPLAPGRVHWVLSDERRGAFCLLTLSAPHSGRYHEFGDSVRPGVQVHGDFWLHKEASLSAVFRVAKETAAGQSFYFSVEILVVVKAWSQDARRIPESPFNRACQLDSD